MKNKICAKCKTPIPKGKEKYMNAKVLCRICFNRAKNFKVFSSEELFKNFLKRRDFGLSWYEKDMVNEDEGRNTKKEKYKSNKGFPYKGSKRNNEK